MLPAGALPFPARLFSSSTGSGNRLTGTSSVELQDLEAAAAAGGAKHKCVANTLSMAQHVGWVIKYSPHCCAHCMRTNDMLF
jgi:hypothetical protein